VIQKSQKEELWYTLQCDPKLCHLHQTFMVSICACVCVCVCACIYLCVAYAACSHDSTRYLVQNPNAQISETHGQSAMS